MNDLFFVASKLFCSLLQPAHFLLLLLVCALLALWLGRPRAARWLLGLPVLALSLIALLPLGGWLMMPLESRFATNPPLPERVDGIVLLGGAMLPLESDAWQQPQISHAADRNFALLELARHYPEARLLFTGGSGRLSQRDLREADVARDFFQRLGLDDARLQYERDSRNTWENALYSRELLQPKPDET